MTKIKICGLTRMEDIECVNELMPDYIGFVFTQSRRQVNEARAMSLKDKLNIGIKSVGVFVNEKPETIVRLCNIGLIDAVQLHGDEGEDYIARLKEGVNVPVIKAVRVRNQRNIINAEKLSCDYLLLDTYKVGQYGGSGESFDWSIVAGINKPFFLAGGIHLDNVLMAINQTNPYAIDVSSGVERDGFKDQSKIREFITKVRRSDVKTWLI